jgi:hypothetical protein
MSDHLEPHALAALFPPISDDELQALADDIRKHGQREPVLTFEGKILDGWNRVRACRLIGRKPWLMEFDQASAKTTPEELVVSANVRRRHLTPAQKAAIAVEWAERVEQDWAEGRSNTFVARVEPGAQGGRPKTAALQDTARLVGVSVSAAYEARRIKLVNETLFAELKAGARSLRSGLDEIEPPAPEPGKEPAMSATEAAETTKEIPAGDQQEAEPAGAPPLANKPAAPRLSRKERVEQAWQDIGRIFCFGQKSLDAFRASQRMSDSEALEFESLESDADKLRVRQAIQNNQSFSEAVKPFAGVDPKEPIQKLHTKTVRNDGFFAGQVGEFYHAVVLGDRAALLERLKGLGAE